MSSPSLTITVNRDRLFKSLCIQVAFIAICGFGLSLAKNRPLSLVLGLVLLVPTAAMTLVSLLRPPKLLIAEDGLRWTGVRPWFVPWQAIARFRAVETNRKPFVAIDYRPEAHAIAKRRPKAIPSVVWMQPVELQPLLQAWLADSRAAESDACVMDVEPATEPALAKPWLSFSLIVVLVLVFIAELAFPVTPERSGSVPSVLTLAAFGGLSRNLLTGPAEWYRLLAVAFIHASPGHLFGNCIALLIAGWTIERVIGAARFAIVYVLGALAGAAGSLLLNDPAAVAVGASGAIMALFSAAFTYSFRVPLSTNRYRLQRGAMTTLAPTLLAFRGPTGTTDFGAHLGGAIGGVLIGAALLSRLKLELSRPKERRLAIAFAGIGAMILLVLAGNGLHRELARAALLMPNDLLADSDASLIKQAPGWSAQYGSDPRVHLLLAMGDLRQGDEKGAEHEAQEGLQDCKAVQGLLLPHIEASLWLVLGEAMVNRNDENEAAAAYDKAGVLDPAMPGLFYDRARLLFRQGDLDKALDAASHYADVAPSPEAWGLVGDLRFAKVNPSGAFEAYQKAAALKESGANERIRGLVRFYGGDPNGAIWDLGRATRDLPTDAYGSLWLVMIKLRQGDPAGFYEDSLATADAPWPAPAFRLLLGKVDVAGVEAAARAEPAQAAARSCEADFYAAEWRLIQKNTADAVSGFEKAVKECPTEFVETWMARNELSKIEAAGTTPPP